MDYNTVGDFLIRLAAIIGAVGVIGGVIIALYVFISRVTSGQRCLLRTEMLRIYYHNRDDGEIRQYEYENFVLLYEAYKKLHGNSFIDKIYEEVKDWKVIS